MQMNILEWNVITNVYGAMSISRTLVIGGLQALAMMRHTFSCVLPEGSQLSIEVVLSVRGAVLADAHGV